MKRKITLDEINQNPKLMEEIAEDEEAFATLKSAIANGKKSIRLEGFGDETVEEEPVEEGVEEIGEEVSGVEEPESENGEVVEEEEDESQEQEESEMDGDLEEEKKEAEEAIDKIKLHYKWYGKEYDTELTTEELATAYQKAMKFPELMNEIDLLREKAKIIDESGLTSDEIDFYKKMKSGDQTAINRFLKTANIDPYSLEVEDAEPVKFERSESGLKVSQPVGEFFSEVRSYSPDSYKRFVDMTNVMPNSLVNAISMNREIATDAFLAVENGIMEKVLPRVIQRTMYDEELNEKIKTNYNDFLRVYQEEAKKLGIVPNSEGNARPQAVNTESPKPADKQVNAKRSKEKLQSSARVRGTSGSAIGEKTFDNMTPQEKIDFMKKLDPASNEWYQFKKKFEKNRR